MKLFRALLASPVIAALLFLIGIVVFVNGGGHATVYKWSQTAATNATADSNINWAEGMAPSAVNDSARAMMAAVAKWRDDMNGATATTGSANAYVLTSNQVFASLATMSGQRICFKPNFTNTSTATLNVDTLGAKAINSVTGVGLNAGALVSGTPYCAVYDNSASEFIITNVNANLQVPLGAILDWPGGAVPNNFLVARGQAISRTTFAALFALISTNWGAGDGSSTFNLPDLGGRVVAGSEASESRLTSAISGCNGGSLGATCGGQAVTLAAGNIPTLTGGNFGHSLSVGTSISNGTSVARGGSTVNNIQNTGGSVNNVLSGSTLESLSLNSGAVSGTISYTNGSQTDVVRVQPTIVLNKIMRVL